MIQTVGRYTAILLNTQKQLLSGCFDYTILVEKKTLMLLFEEMGEDSIQALLFQLGQGERATFGNLSTKTACCCLA